jgi:hydrogenase expression/formation protein HypE
MTMTMTAKKNYLRPIDFKHGHRHDARRRRAGRGATGGRAVCHAPLTTSICARATMAPCCRFPLGRLVMATDGHVISPLFFPGGDIGCLSVHGTVNDVAMSGAKPLYLAASFILEEGFALADLKRIVESMAAAAREAGVPNRHRRHQGGGEGQGRRRVHQHHRRGRGPDGLCIDGRQARAGDVILVSGTVGEHGVAVMSLRESLEFETAITSDTAALHTLVQAMLQALPDPNRFARAARPHARRAGHHAQRNRHAVSSRHGD